MFIGSVASNLKCIRRDRVRGLPVFLRGSAAGTRGCYIVPLRFLSLRLYNSRRSRTAGPDFLSRVSRQ